MDDQINEPNRTDYYLMQLAQAVRQQWNEKQVSLESQRLKFVKQKIDKPNEAQETAPTLKQLASAIAAVGSRNGSSPRTRNRANGGKAGR